MPHHGTWRRLAVYQGLAAHRGDQRIDELNSAVGVLFSETLPKTRPAASSTSSTTSSTWAANFVQGASHHGREAREPARGGGRADQRRAVAAEGIHPAGGARAAALAHVARTVCRRAERAVIVLAATESVSTNARVYLNRLSDLLFVLARALNRAGGRTDVLWQKQRTRGPSA